MLINISASDVSYLLEPFSEEMLLVASRSAVVVSWSIQILFSILVRHVTIILAGLNRQMEVILCPGGSLRLITMQLETWRMNYALVCEMVGCINECFGLVLLISIGYYSISLIVLSQDVYADFGQYFFGDSLSICYRPFITVLLMARHLVHLILVVVMPYQMQKEVRIHNISQNPFLFFLFSIMGVVHGVDRGTYPLYFLKRLNCNI